MIKKHKIGSFCASHEPKYIPCLLTCPVGRKRVNESCVGWRMLRSFNSVHPKFQQVLEVEFRGSNGGGGRVGTQDPWPFSLISFWEAANLESLRIHAQ